MKILHLLTSNRFSGAENVVCQIINMFKDERDIEMIYVCPEGQICESLLERNIQFISMKNFSTKEIKDVLIHEKPDVIHAHDMRASFYASLVCGRTPLVSHIHNNAFDSRKISIKSLLYLYSAIKSKCIFWVSNSSFEGYIFHNFFKGKSTVLYNVIDERDLYKKVSTDTNEYEYDIIYIGRLVHQKNPQRMMKVLSLVKERISSVKIAIVGAGELEEEIKEIAKLSGLSDNVCFVGYKTNPLKLLKDSKVMIMTSRWEGTPMCALESLALGVPIVSTPTDGMKELIKNGENGFLSDDDQELADKIVWILSDKKQLDYLSDNSIVFSKGYNNLQDYKKRILESYY